MGISGRHARRGRWLALPFAGLLVACGGGGGGAAGGSNPGANPGRSALPGLSVADARAEEANGTGARFAVTLSAAATDTVTVDYSLAALSASAGDDFDALNGTLSIPAGSTGGDILVAIADDACYENEETFSLSLSNVSPNATLRTALATGTIVSDDAPVVLSLADASLEEGNTGNSAMTFTVMADHAECRDITATFAINAVTARVGEDFIDTTGTFVLPAGSTSGTITVPVIGDLQIETHETLSLNLANLSDNATATRSDATGVIRNDDLPRLSVVGADILEGNSGSKTLAFLVALEAPTSSPVTVNFITLDGTATMADNDYLPVRGTFTIAQGSTQQEVEVQIVGDAVVEPNESFSARIGDVQGDAVLFIDTSSATIIDDDAAGTVPTEVSVRSASIDEGDAGSVLMRFAVDVAPAAADPVSFDFQTHDGSALAGGDYTAAAGRFTIPAGALFAELTVPVLGDTEQEGDEEFSVELGNVSGNAILRTAQVTGRINDDDAAPALPRFSINDPNTVEGDAGTTPMTFIITLSAPPAATVTVDYATADGTANAASGNDYVPVSGTLTFIAGETQQMVTVLINGDTVVEASESLRLELSNVTGDAELIDTFGAGTILTDDILPALGIADASFLEGDPGAGHDLVFTVTMDRTSTTEVTFDYATRNATALAGEDFVAASGTAVIPAGTLTATIAIELLGDTDVEFDEQFFVDLTNVSANATLANALATGTLINDDNLTSGWQAPVPLDTDPRDSRLPVIEMNESGGALAVWRSSTSSFGMLYGRRYSPATGWSATESVTTDAVDNFSFDVTINGGGAAIAAWNNNGAKVRHFAPATGWAAPVTVDSSFFSLDYIKVDNNDSDAAAITTHNYNAGTPPPYRDTYASLFDPVAGAWGTPLTPIEFDNQATFTPDIALDAAGNAFAVWSQGTVWVSRHSADTLLWSTPQRLAAELSPGVYRPGDFPAVTTDYAGNAFVTWYESTGTGATRANVSRYDVATDTWPATPFILNSNAARRAVAPQLAVDNDGNAFAVWLEDDGSGGGSASYDIWFRRYDAVSGAWSPASLVQDLNLSLRLVASRYDTPTLAVNHLGNALVVWSQNVGGRYIVRATTFADDEWSAPEEISDGTSPDASLPRVVMDRANRGVAIWQQSNPASGDLEVWAAEYLLSAAP